MPPTPKTYKPKTYTLKLSQNMTGKFINFSVDGDQLTARYLGSEYQLAEMLEVAGKDSPIFANAVKLAFANLNAKTEKEATIKSMSEEVKKVFKKSTKHIIVKDAYHQFVEKTGTKTDEPKFTAAMSMADFKLYSRDGGNNTKRYYMIEII